MTVDSRAHCKANSLWKIMKKQKYLIFMILPFVVWVIIFRYLPIAGWITAFQDYKPKAGMGVFDYPFVGLKHFKTLFQDPMFYTVMRNTLAMGLMQLIFGFPLPIILAILLNEVKSIKYKRFVQTCTYLPHFVSWVIVASIFTTLLSDSGAINEFLQFVGIIKEPISFLSKPELFWGISTSAEIWKELGWNSILFLAAITAIDPTLYEAANVDGASRWQAIKYITIPGIAGTILVVLVLDIGWMISIGFEKQYLLGNSVVQDYAKVIELYALDYGIKLGRYSYGTAIGMFTSVISIFLLFTANKTAKKWTGESVL
jgi:putative aldouronate transport system permease protein